MKRKKSSLSQEALAGKVGQQRSYILALEKGKKAGVSYYMAARLAKALGYRSLRAFLTPDAAEKKLQVAADDPVDVVNLRELLATGNEDLVAPVRMLIEGQLARARLFESDQGRPVSDDLPIRVSGKPGEL